MQNQKHHCHKSKLLHFKEKDEWNWKQNIISARNENNSGTVVYRFYHRRKEPDIQKYRAVLYQLNMVTKVRDE